MSRDYFDDGYDFTTNRITLPNGEAVLITPSRNKHRLYIADLPVAYQIGLRGGASRSQRTTTSSTTAAISTSSARWTMTNVSLS